MSLVAPLLLGASSAWAKVETKEIQYEGGGVTMKGYLAFDPKVEGKRPGVLVVHEWWGHNDYARMRARMLAEMGYVALAVDMYGDGKTADHPSDAGKFANAVMSNLDLATARFDAALQTLQKDERVDPARIAAIGYCFGGGVVLHMARQGAKLRGVASFHGSLAAKAPAKKGAVKAEILVLHGAEDRFVSPKDIEAFKSEMHDAGAKMQFIAYPGAVHSFTNPNAGEVGKKFNLPLAYNAEADKKSWAELDGFLKRVLKTGG